MTCRPKPQPGAWNLGLLHRFHSGESFGLGGQIVSLLSGCALLFFAFSGLWMYIRMFRVRRSMVRHGKHLRGGRFFWR